MEEHLEEVDRQVMLVLGLQEPLLQPQPEGEEEEHLEETEEEESEEVAMGDLGPRLNPQVPGPHHQVGRG